MKNTINQNWHRLDNTGKMYPLIRSDWQTTLYRLTAVLKSNIDVQRLKDSIPRVYEVYPEFNVVLKPGLFWFYFEKTNERHTAKPDDHYPCTSFEKDFSILPIHVYYSENLLSVEFCHALTDGYGATEFFKTLLSEYFSGSGYSTVENTKTVIDEKNNRWEDSYLKHYDPSIPGMKRRSKAFHFPYNIVSPGVYYSTTGTIPLNDILKKAKSYGCTITEWLTSFYILTISEMIQDFHWKPAPVVINVPVNLRVLYNSKTLRNFFVTIMPQIDCRFGYFTLEEIISHVKNYMSLEVDRRYINQQFKRNIDVESNMAIRLIPLPLKRLIFSVLYYYLGERQYSGGLSNLGAFKLPEAIRHEVEEVRLLTPPSQGTLIKAGCISYNDRFCITFGSLVNEREFERRFFSGLRKQGLPVKISVNY